MYNDVTMIYVLESNIGLVQWELLNLLYFAQEICHVHMEYLLSAEHVLRGIQGAKKIYKILCEHRIALESIKLY